MIDANDIHKCGHKVLRICRAFLTRAERRLRDQLPCLGHWLRWSDFEKHSRGRIQRTAHSELSKAFLNRRLYVSLANALANQFCSSRVRFVNQPKNGDDHRMFSPEREFESFIFAKLKPDPFHDVSQSEVHCPIPRK
jgi:hypothetical protein